MKKILTLIMSMVFMIPSTLHAINTMTADTVADVFARQLSNEQVEVVWSWEDIVPTATFIDFETGDFSQGNFTNDEEYPWEITQDAYEGNYAVKSTNEGVDYGEHFLNLEVDVPYDAVMSFYHKVSSEWMYDGGVFYIDGKSKASMTGTDKDWEYVEVSVPAGKHTYTWGYFKDESDFDGEDTYWVDNIVPFAPREEVAEGWLHYDDGVFANAAGMGSVGADNYWAVSFPDMSAYAGKTLTKVATMVYQGSNVTASICLGGTDAPGTVVSTKSFTATPGQVVEVELDTPVSIDGTQPLWIVMYCNDAEFPSAASAFCGDPNSSWFGYNNQWAPVENWGLTPMSWIIRGFVEDAEGRTVAISQGELTPMATTAGEVMAFTPEKRKIVGTPSRTPRNENIFNLYKKNVFSGGEAQLIAEGLTDTAYIDNAWGTATAGIYQWGVEVVNNRSINRNEIFSENFDAESEIPDGWIATSPLDYYTPSDWYVAQYGLMSSPTGLTPMGERAAYSEGYSYNGDCFNLITPAIDLTATTAPSLSFYYANPDYAGDLSVLNVKVALSQEGPWTKVWTTGEDFVTEWTQHTIDLSEYAGQTVYVSFENEDYYGCGIGIDNVVVAEGSGNDNPTGSIVWSNPLDKDMFTTVEVTVTLNTSESMSGTMVTFANVNEADYSYEAKLDATGQYVWNEFRRGTYELTVYKQGYESGKTEEVVEILDETSFEFVLTEVINNIESLYVSPTGWAMWEADEVALKGDEFSFGFEDGTMNGWVTYDVDADSNTWKHVWDFWGENYGYNSNASILSASYTNEIGPLSPDNYIVTEEKYLIGDASQLTFMVSPYDDNYPNEHYGVAVSTTGNTPEELVMIWEETLLAGKGGTRDTDAVRGQNINRIGNWYLRTVDLSAFSGQEVYIALRHFNCTDQYIFFIDDITLTNAAKTSRSVESYTVLLNGVEEATVTEMNYRHENVTPGETYTTTVIANYVSGQSNPIEYTWTCVACDEYEGVSEFEVEYSDGNAVLSWVLPEDAQGVIIYRDGELLAEDIVTVESYYDPMTESATYEYCLEVLHEDYGVSCSQCVEFKYTVSVAENNAKVMSVYPNPVKDNLTIAAENMKQITIVNTLGQVVLEQNVVSDNEVIDMTQYEAGIYIVRVATETGVAVERVTVVR